MNGLTHDQQYDLDSALEENDFGYNRDDEELEYLGY